jgi:hypothetical protein
MKTKVSTTLILSAALLILLGCSTAQPTQVVEVVPPPEITPMPLPPYGNRGPNDPTRPESDLPAARVCQLGTSCLAMDSRPFEMCLLGTQKRCSDKREVMQVEIPGVEPR